ncbi:MAG: T9SS type A sorting domain-containing protein [Rhodothermaceae bacterium]|nr:T9SS type A sorting domain-containing protein [Rhodothermaceae bacterium]
MIKTTEVTFPCLWLCALVVVISTGLVNSATAQSITSCTLFEEQGGLVVLEVESVLPSDSWSLRNDISSALGNGYYEWKHGDNDQGIDAAGMGILTYTFEISLAGSYRFLLRSSSPDNTEHNDVWVRFPDNPATGIRQRGPGSIEIQRNSWFKVYQNTSGQEWKWDARTVDFDPHSIFLTIDEPGTYSVELSGRSTLFKIDRIVLHHEQVRFTDATRLDNEESVCLQTETIALRPPDEPEAPQPGIHYAYYEGNWTNVPDFATLTPIDAGIVHGFDISRFQRDDYFGFVFEGLIQAPSDGLYTFYTISNSGSLLFIGDELVVDNDGAHSARERNGLIGLAAGWHEISLLYFEDFFTQSLEVSWVTPGESREIIGEGNLFYDLDDVLPSAELVRFEGSIDPAGVALTWETASELNNAGFEIERRYETHSQTMADTVAFLPITFIDGNGTTVSSEQYSYTDTSIPALARVVYYRFKQITLSGAFTYSDVVSVELPTPEAIALYPNYPNPFNLSTTVAFDLSEESPVRLSLFNASGQLVKVLVEGIRPPGRNEFTLTLPASLTSGLYMYQLETPEESHSRTMTLIR